MFLALGGQIVGCQDGVIVNSLNLILYVPQFFPEEKRFDIMMLALILLINMIEQSESNKNLLSMSKVIAADKGINRFILLLIIKY